MYMFIYLFIYMFIYLFMCVCVSPFENHHFALGLEAPFFFALDSAYEFHQASDLHGIVLSFEVPR